MRTRSLRRPRRCGWGRGVPVPGTAATCLLKGLGERFDASGVGDALTTRSGRVRRVRTERWRERDRSGVGDPGPEVLCEGPTGATVSTGALAAGNGRFVDSLARDLLGRQPTPAELTAWVGQLDAGSLDRTQLALQLASGDELAGRSSTTCSPSCWTGPRPRVSGRSWWRGPGRRVRRATGHPSSLVSRSSSRQGGRHERGSWPPWAADPAGPIGRRDRSLVADLDAATRTPWRGRGGPVWAGRGGAGSGEGGAVVELQPHRVELSTGSWAVTWRHRADAG
jgi:hypothetical protein